MYIYAFILFGIEIQNKFKLMNNEYNQAHNRQLVIFSTYEYTIFDGSI